MSSDCYKTCHDGMTLEIKTSLIYLPFLLLFLSDMLVRCSFRATPAAFPMMDDYKTISDSSLQNVQIYVQYNNNNMWEIFTKELINGVNGSETIFRVRCQVKHSNNKISLQKPPTQIFFFWNGRVLVLVAKTTFQQFLRSGLIFFHFFHS